MGGPCRWRGGPERPWCHGAALLLSGRGDSDDASCAACLIIDGLIGDIDISDDLTSDDLMIRDDLISDDLMISDDLISDDLMIRDDLISDDLMVRDTTLSVMTW